MGSCKYSKEAYLRSKPYRKKYYKEHKEDINAKRRNSYAKNDKMKNRLKAYRIKHKDRYEIHRKKALLKKYNISIEEYNNILIKQENSCAICRIHESEINKFCLGVDHNHKTGKVRGLLCSNCNSGIGNLRDSISLLQKAIQYIAMHDLEVPDTTGNAGVVS